VGRRVTAPAAGTVTGIAATGGLCIRGDDGSDQRCQSGSLIFAD
jgi:biotin-(acetyl-CoA carboxylase) ligase